MLMSNRGDRFAMSRGATCPGQQPQTRASSTATRNPLSPNPKQHPDVTAAAFPSALPFPHADLVRAAVLAPSPDNNQPWRFAAQANRLLVYLDPSRALPSDVHSADEAGDSTAAA